MTFQGRTLSLECTGTDVRLLHRELTMLGHAIAEEERRAASFGVTTREAVLTFQMKCGLAPTAIVDGATAQALTREVNKLPPSARSFVVRGVVAGSDGRPLPDVAVNVVDRDLRHEQRLGDTRTDADGRYEVEYSAGQFRRAEKGRADLVVAALGAGDALLARSPILFNAPAEATIDLTIPRPIPCEWDQLTAAIPPLLDDQGVRADQLNDADASFIGGETGLDRERVRLWSLARGMAVAADAIGAPCFYGWLRQGLPSTLPELLLQPAARLQEALENSVRANIIPAMSAGEMADVLARIRTTSVDHVLRSGPTAGASSTFGALVQGTVRPDAREAVARAYVEQAPALTAEASGDNLATVEQSGRGQQFWSALSSDDRVSTDDISDLKWALTLHQITDGHAPLVSALQRLRADNPSLATPQGLAGLDEKEWTTILLGRRDPENPLSAPVGTPGRHDSVADYARTLVDGVRRQFPMAVFANYIERAPDGAFSSLRDDLSSFFAHNPTFSFADQPVAAYLSVDPASKLRGVKRPELLKAHLTRMGRLYPFAPVPAQMDALLNDKVFSAHAVVMMGAAEFRRRYSGVFGGESNSSRAFSAARDVASQALVLFHRLGAMANRPLPAALAPDGSVVDVTALNPVERATWQSMFGSLDMCQCDECQSLTGPAAYFFDTLEFVKQMHVQEGYSTPLTELLRRRPDLAHLELTCENVNVKLPYVDLVNEILENGVARRQKVISGTFAAADFDAGTIPAALAQALALTPKATIGVNADAPVKTWAIRDAGWRHVFGFTEGPNAVVAEPYPQSSLGEPELAANPEHINGPAYARLARAAYPWAAPFNLAVESSRVYLGQLGVTRYELMESLAAPDAVLSDEAIVHERLGLTALDACIITGVMTSTTTGAEPWTFWGFSGQNVAGIPDPNDPQNMAATLSGLWSDVLRRVPILLTQSGLKYQDLLELLVTDSLNPIAGSQRTMAVTSIDANTAATCDLNKLQVTGLTESIAAQIHRFVRLQRSLGWTVFELDRALSAFGAADFPSLTPASMAALLARLAHVARLSTRFSVPVVSVLAFYTPIDTRAYPNPGGEAGAAQLGSLYDHLFRNRAVSSPVDAAFVEDATQLQGTLSGHSATILGALRISASEFALLTIGPSAVVTSDALTLGNLSTLYRHATLAHALKLSVPDLLQAIALIGSNPFADTEATIRFADRVATIRRAGFTVAQLIYLLRHQASDAAYLASADDQATALVSELRDGLRKIADDEGMVPDPQGSEVSKRLARLNWNQAHIDQLVSIVSDRGETAVTLASMPAGIVIPDTLSARMSYRAGELRFRGVMTAAEQTALQNADSQAGPTPFKTAVGTLYTNSRAAALTFCERRARAFELPTFHAPTAPPLLTHTVTFPDALKTRIQYNTTNHTIEATGAFSDTELTLLRGAFTADAVYQSAIQSLDDQATRYAPEADNQLLFSSADPAGDPTRTSFTALFDTGRTVAERFAYLLDRVAGYLRARDSEAFVKETLTEALKLPAPVVDVFVGELLTAGTGALQTSALAALTDPVFAASEGDITVQAFPTQVQVVMRVQKAAAFATRYALTADDVRAVQRLSAAAQWFDWNAVPVVGQPGTIAFDAWETLNGALDLRRPPFVTADAPVDLIALAQATGTTKASFVQAVVTATRWDVEALRVLAGPDNTPGNGALNLAFPADYVDGSGLLRLRSCFQLIQRLGISATQLAAWTLPNLAADISTDQGWATALANADAVKNAVKSKYDDEQWLTLAKPLRDRLREKQRAALVAHLIATNTAGVDEADLYEYYLIDVQMGSCMRTTRLMQAVCSVQLFVQRCLMNLEPGMALTPEQAAEWHTWRRLQRVAEANREVFLYPENWIQPELRDDKSPLFKDLENELQQNDVTAATAEDAMRHYLEKLDEVARLEIVGLCRQPDPAVADGSSDVLHVFGRTYATPRRYFYRRFEGQIDKGRWTPWEKVDLDIAGDHLIPVVWNRHLYVAWPIFTEKTKPQTKEQRANSDDPEKYWEIKLAWSEYRNRRWLPKRISERFLEQAKAIGAPEDPADFTFLARIRERNPLNFWDRGYTGSQLLIDCYGAFSSVTMPAPADTPSVQLGSIPVWTPGPESFFGLDNVTHIKAIVNKTDQAIQVFDMEDATAAGNGMQVAPGGYLAVNMNAPWADSQYDFLNRGKRLEVATMSGTLLFCVWQSNRADGDYVRFSTDGAWHDPGLHCGMIRNDHALVVSPASVSLAGLVAPVLYTYEFRVENAPIRPSEMSALTVEARWPNGRQSYPLNGYGRVVLAQDARFARDIYLVSDRYTLDGAVSVSNAFVNGMLMEQRIVVPLATITPAAAPQPTATGPVRQQAIGCFASNECHSDMTAMTAAAAFPGVEPATLEPLGRTAYVNMMMVEQPGASNTFGQNTVVLASTPGTFRVLTRPDGYVSGHVTFPFAYQDDQRTYLGWATKFGSGSSVTYKTRFNALFHPRICAFLDDLDRAGLPALLQRQTQTVDDAGTFISTYSPSAAFVDLDVPGDATRRTPREDVDFSYGGAYSLYNWEVFFHIPFLIATRLTKNQRFEDARTWFHFIFDPTSAESGGRERFWRFKPFYDDARRAPQTLADFIASTSQALDEQVAAWKADPFQPYVIARLRTLAFMKTIVMRYIDNLIQWGDQLFSRDNLESVNEATQLYILALRILGKRPAEVPPRAVPAVHTFDSLEAWKAVHPTALNAFGEAVVAIEDYLPPNAAPNGLGSTGLGTLGSMPLFCIPQNEVLLRYWDTVEDRLAKIRHCQNIQGVTRELAIFAPKIDPALLVAAAAAGVDLDSVLADAFAPLPSYRFAVMHQKAMELCGDVRSLGSALLMALEKRDAETLAALRSGHEVDVLNAVRQVKAQQVEEAQNTLDGLKRYQDVVTARQQYYASRPFMNPFELAHIDQVQGSFGLIGVHAALETIAGVLHLIPNAKAGGPTTVGVTYGGANVGSALQAFGGALSAVANIMSTSGSLSATMGGYLRRKDDWALQVDLATKELEQIKKQIAAADVRLAIANLELTNHELQTDHAKAVDEFMHAKYTDAELYDWMVGQTAAAYFQTYKLAYDAAKRAERCYRFELGLSDSRVVQFGYWDSLRKGLLAGEQLQLDLRRLEADYLQRNSRQFEITRSVSLLLHDPTALMRLKNTGRCEIELPESLFDMDYPGHYLRRIKSVTLTIPCVTGPYTSVNCTLTLLANKIRMQNTPPVTYPEAPDDSRFLTDFGGREAIATSHAQSDNGLFELNFRDDRYLPFEGRGAISQWRIELPQESNAFDLDTITDVVLQLQYTAKDGGGALRDAAADAVRTLLTQTTPLVRAFSLRHEFPTEWNRFLYSTALVDTVADHTHSGVDQRLRLDLSDRFPFQRRAGSIAIASARVFLKLRDELADQYSDATPLSMDLSKVSGGVTTAFATASPLLEGGSAIAGLPTAMLFNGQTEDPGTWELRIVEARTDSNGQPVLTGTADLPATLRETVTIAGATHARLNAHAVEDIILLCVYGFS
jgi:hypothetical protein